LELFLYKMSENESFHFKCPGMKIDFSTNIYNIFIGINF
jgi:hypothetical protein